jgi:hypothetical protein
MSPLNVSTETGTKTILLALYRWHMSAYAIYLNCCLLFVYVTEGWRSRNKWIWPIFSGHFQYFPCEQDSTIGKLWKTITALHFMECIVSAPLKYYGRFMISVNLSLMKHRAGIRYLCWQEIMTTINGLNMYVSAVFDILTLIRQNSSSERHLQQFHPLLPWQSLLSSVLDSKDSTPLLSNPTIGHSCMPDLSIYHTPQLISPGCVMPIIKLSADSRARKFNIINNIPHRSTILGEFLASPVFITITLIFISPLD